MFSVIVPLFNKEKEVLQTIESVLNQSYSNFELIIVNDSSTDKSVEIVEGIKDTRIKILTKPNGGVSSARNLGILKARFEYIAFLDADDLWEKDYLMSIKNAIINYPDKLVIATNYKIRLASNRFYRPKFLWINSKSSISIVNDYFTFSKHDTVLTSSSVVIHKNVFEKIGHFDLKLTHGEDLDFWIRISRRYNMIFVNRTLVIYRYDSSNRSINKLPDFEKIFISKYQLNGNRNRDYFLSKSAYRFGINYLVNGSDSLALLCRNKILKRSTFYYKFFILYLLPLNIRKIIYEFYMRHVILKEVS